MIEIYWKDLTPAKQMEILCKFGDNGNFDIFPIAQILEDDDEDDN